MRLTARSLLPFVAALTRAFRRWRIAPATRKGTSMSSRKMGARAALATAGVLVSVALMAAPSWAAPGGNSANDSLCHNYPGVLLAQDGSAFTNAGKCTAYGARGGQIAGVNAVAEPLSGGLRVTWTGFGMEPGSVAFGGTRYQPSGVSVGNFDIVDSDGTFVVVRANPCVSSFGTVGSLAVQATTAAGTEFVRDVPLPPGIC